MAITLQVLYPVGPDTHFNYDYYFDKHFEVVNDCIGSEISSLHVVKGVAGGPDVPPPFYAIATMEFASQANLDKAMADVGPALADIDEFTNVKPQMLIGESLISSR
jgi:uncharacterized protein (TIGR02118 family)